MPKKIDLVFLPQYKSSFLASYIEPEALKYFNLLCYDTTCSYSKSSTVFVSQSSQDIELANQLYEQGYKVATEDLWEYTESHPRYHTVASKRWFWINECLWLNQLGRREYRPNKKFTKLAFMPIGRKKIFRDRVISTLKPWLNDCIWSYATQRLPDDCMHDTGIIWQRYFNPAWYDDTYFSLVVETMTDGFFVTEKTFKPLAYKHPFMILGTAHTLAALKSWGFETFNEMFDESYDSSSIFDHRLGQVVQNIKHYVKEPYSAITWEKINHNHERFWNQNLVREMFVTDIVEPLLEHVND